MRADAASRGGGLVKFATPAGLGSTAIQPLSGEHRTLGGRGRHAAHDPNSPRFPDLRPACSFENAPVVPPCLTIPPAIPK